MLSKTLDVAIGIVFLFLLTSLVASTIVELAATRSNWRGRMLRSTIFEMFRTSALVEPAEVYSDPLISTLTIGGRIPSYIPPSSFSAAVVDVLLTRTPSATAPSDILKAASKRGTDDALYSLLATTIAMRGDNFQAIAFALEKWFKDTMDRTTGTYKRHTRKWLFIVGLLFAISCNINTVAVAQWLWKGDNARQVVVAEAMGYVKAHPDLIKQNAVPIPDAASDPSKASAADLKAFANTYAEFDRELTRADWPLGWSHVSWSVAGLLQFVVGALLSSMAIAMGSSFWFDSLQSLIKIRGTGPKP